MNNPNQLCVRLLSSLVPCPWLTSIPELKRTRDRLTVDIGDLKTPLPKYLQETMKVCEGCTHYDPVDVYRRVG